MVTKFSLVPLRSSNLLSTSSHVRVLRNLAFYNSSPAARAVWDGADTHLLATYGFCQQYTYDKKGNVKTLPLFVDINNQTPRYTFSHPTGLIFATRFAQIALVVIEKAAFDDMRSKGFIQNRSAFAGHSLGEYSAPASITHVLERDFKPFKLCYVCSVFPKLSTMLLYVWSRRKSIYCFKSSTSTLRYYDLVCHWKACTDYCDVVSTICLRWRACVADHDQRAQWSQGQECWRDWSLRMIFVFKSFLLIPAALRKTLSEEKMLSEIIASCFGPRPDRAWAWFCHYPASLSRYLWTGVRPCERWSLSIMSHELCTQSHRPTFWYFTWIHGHRLWPNLIPSPKVGWGRLGDSRNRQKLAYIIRAFHRIGSLTDSYWHGHLKAKYESSDVVASSLATRKIEVYCQYEDKPEPLARAVPTETISTSTTLVSTPIFAPVVDAAGPVASIPALSNW